jgi:hypothetical protein
LFQAGQSRKATFFIALHCPSVFTKTWGQPGSVDVALIGWCGFLSLPLLPLDVGGFLT